MAGSFRKAGRWVFGVVGSVLASEGAFYISDKLGVARHLDITGNSITAMGAQTGFELFDRVFGRDKDEPKVGFGTKLATAAIGGAEIKAIEALVTEGAKSYVKRVPEDATGLVKRGRDHFEQLIELRQTLGRRKIIPDTDLEEVADHTHPAFRHMNTVIRYALTAGAGIAGTEAGRPVQSLFANMKRVGIG